MALKADDLTFKECIALLSKLSNDIIENVDYDLICLMDVFDGKHKNLDPKKYEKFLQETDALENYAELMKFWANDTLIIDRDAISKEELDDILMLGLNMSACILDFNALYRENGMANLYESQMAKSNSIISMKIAGILNRMKKINSGG